MINDFTGLKERYSGTDLGRITELYYVLNEAANETDI